MSEKTITKVLKTGGEWAVDFLNLLGLGTAADDIKSMIGQKDLDRLYDIYLKEGKESRKLQAEVSRLQMKLSDMSYRNPSNPIVRRNLQRKKEAIEDRIVDLEKQSQAKADTSNLALSTYMNKPSTHIMRQIEKKIKEDK